MTFFCEKWVFLSKLFRQRNFEKLSNVFRRLIRFVIRFVKVFLNSNFENPYNFVIFHYLSFLKMTEKRHILENKWKWAVAFGRKNCNLWENPVSDYRIGNFKCRKTSNWNFLNFFLKNHEKFHISNTIKIVGLCSQF